MAYDVWVCLSLGEPLLLSASGREIATQGISGILKCSADMPRRFLSVLRGQQKMKQPSYTACIDVLAKLLVADTPCSPLYVFFAFSVILFQRNLF